MTSTKPKNNCYYFQNQVQNSFLLIISNSKEKIADNFKAFKIFTNGETGK